MWSSSPKESSWPSTMQIASTHGMVSPWSSYSRKAWKPLGVEGREEEVSGGGVWGGGRCGVCAGGGRAAGGGRRAAGRASPVDQSEEEAHAEERLEPNREEEPRRPRRQLAEHEGDHHPVREAAAAQQTKLLPQPVRLEMTERRVPASEATRRGSASGGRAAAGGRGGRGGWRVAGGRARTRSCGRRCGGRRGGSRGARCGRGPTGRRSLRGRRQAGGACACGSW